MNQLKTQPKTQPKTVNQYSSLELYDSKALSRYRASLDKVVVDAAYHAQTLLLFTCDQILDTVIPGTAFGVLAALSGPTLDLPVQWTLSILSRIPQLSFWLWLVILQFCVQNQRSSDSTAEDGINKPWRPIPSGRLATKQADKLLAVTNVIAGALSYRLNLMPIFFVYMCLITAYNDHGGGNKSGLVRNLFCGAGFSCYFSGALSIAVGSDVSLSSAAWKWTTIVALGILATTIQTQEFRDEAGDQARGRHTLVTELGRKAALWTVFVSVTFWSVYIPLGFFAGGWKISLLPLVFSALLLTTTFQAYYKGNSKLDRKMYKIWCLWMFSFCSLPFLASVLV